MNEKDCYLAGLSCAEIIKLREYLSPAGAFTQGLIDGLKEQGLTIAEASPTSLSELENRLRDVLSLLQEMAPPSHIK